MVGKGYPILLHCHSAFGHRERRLLSLVLLSVGIASVFLGLAQIAQGPSSSLRPFDYTNDTEAVGFFANRIALGILVLEEPIEHVRGKPLRWRLSV